MYLVEELDVVKFMCKEFWYILFRKQIDKLQTDYKGVYVLHDYTFKLLSKCHPITNMKEKEEQTLNYTEECKLQTSYTCGIIRGALGILGVIASVKADISKFPACKFHLLDVAKNRTRTSTITNTSATPSTGSTISRSNSQLDQLTSSMSQLSGLQGTTNVSTQNATIVTDT
jgi:hypothetical protein